MTNSSRGDHAAIFAFMLAQLQRGSAMFDAALDGVTGDEAKWKPPSGAWSIIEIVNHLADEEVEDFRTRFRMTLEDPSKGWPPIDPEAAARARKYHERDFAESCHRFKAARLESLIWLRSLDPSALDLSRSRTHPAAGTLHAGDLLASWAAHDLLHIRQIVKRRFEYLAHHAQPYRTAYAGSW